MEWEDRIDQEHELLIKVLPDYPDSTEEILETWPTRAKLWDKWNQGWEYEWRLDFCAVQDRCSMLTIDADSYSRESIQRKPKQQQIRDKKRSRNSDDDDDSDGDSDSERN
jgi:hypothetical protein